MFIKRNGKQPQDDSSHAFPVKRQPILLLARSKAVVWVQDQVPLFEAFCLALTIHVLSFPLLWAAGWALPWPKGPGFVTVIEINLENWPNEAVPEKVNQLLNPHKKKP